MGAEDFQVTLTSPCPEQDVASVLRAHAGLRAVDVEFPIPGRTTYIYEDALHIVELEVWSSTIGEEVMVSMRFALCQPPSVDRRFTEMLLSLGERLRASLVINDEVDDADQWSYGPDELATAVPILQNAIAKKRALWIADFGAEEAKATCAAAVKRYMVDRFG